MQIINFICKIRLKKIYLGPTNPGVLHSRCLKRNDDVGMQRVKAGPPVSHPQCAEIGLVDAARPASGH